MKRTTRRRIKSGFAAFGRGLPRALLVLPITLLMPMIYGINRLALYQSTRAKRGSIRITALDEDHENFVRVTLDALALIETHDPRRYARLQNEVRFITDGPLTSFGRYHYEGRECVIDFAKVDFDWNDTATPHYAYYYAWYLARLAAAIVHEAAHAHLHTLGIPYAKETRARSERICVAEECRFAARLPQSPHDFGRDLVTPFDPERWETSWNATPLQRLKSGLCRIKERNKELARRAADPKTPSYALVVPAPVAPTGPLRVIGTRTKIPNSPPKPTAPYSIWPAKPVETPKNAPTIDLPDCAAFVVHSRRKRAKNRVE